MISLRQLPFAAGASFLLSAALVRLTIYICTKRTWTATPRDDRWHKSTPALFGGIPLWAAFVTVAAFVLRGKLIWELIGLSTLILLLGLLDDIVKLRPRTKVVAEAAAGLAVVGIGIFYPASRNFAFNAGLSIFWVVAITNAVNLIDNMDGAAGSVALVATISIAFLAFAAGESELLMALCVFAGVLAGFVVFNLTPARIFLGDTGSLTIGFFLGSVVLLPGIRPAQPSLWALCLPCLIFIVPLFDTALVSLSRLRRGVPVYQGGTDHTSHRLAHLGVSERAVVFVFSAITAVSSYIGYSSFQSHSPDALATIAAWIFALAVLGAQFLQSEVPSQLRRRPLLLQAGSQRPRSQEDVVAQSSDVIARVG